MTNLVQNALKFTKEGDTVKITAGIIEESGAREIGISVEDTGKGIPPDSLIKIFDKFYQLDKDSFARKQGIGLGLALCKEIVELHGGTIWAESEGEGRGSRFFIKLPAG